MKAKWQILVVDDEEVMRESLAAWLGEDGYTVDTAESGKRAVDLAKSTDYAIYFIDLKMPIHKDAPVVIVTAYATVDTAISAIKEGALEYIVKPCNPQEISLLVERIIKVKNLQRENAILRQQLQRNYQYRDIVTKNPKMQEILQLTAEISGLRSTVLIRGESGTGKELIARAIHFSGDRASKPFITVSCAALAETLLESELFGYEKGAFTGAGAQTRGKFEMANGGTIFLDEIGDIPPKLQADLLRVLQERCFYRLGGTTEIRVDVRVVAATHKNLAEEVHEGRFRDDLYYRLNVIEITIPPLRNRREDIPLLTNHLIERISHEVGKDITDISESALRVLLDHDWPGNVRELENALERAIVTCRNHTLTEDDFAFLAASHPRKGFAIPAGMTLQQLEKQAIVATLDRTQGNIKEAAGLLGIDRSTLYEKIKKYDIERSEAVVR